MDAATIEALEHDPTAPLQRSAYRRERSSRTVRYVLKASRNRDILFHYSSSRAHLLPRPLRSVSAWEKYTSFEASRQVLQAGRQFYSGDASRADPVPSGGKLLKMPAYFPRRWRTPSTLRTT